MIGTKYYFCANARLSEFPGVIRVCRVAQFAICWLDFVQKERSSQQRELFDVIVVGGGNAAMCAALAARRIGASVLVLERATEHMRGGNTRHT
jgi:NADPH-dependent glutamate synthase beta subunit-like oxidoreductase